MPRHRLLARLLGGALIGGALIAGALADGGARDIGGDLAFESATPASPGSNGVVPTTADDDVASLVSWAYGRFARLELPAPHVTSILAVVQDGCGGRPAWVTLAGDEVVVALCEDLEVRRPAYRGVEVLSDEAKRYLLHELSHVWIEEHVDAETRERFMAYSGAVSWDDPALPWHARGVEQAAETLAWGLRSEPTATPAGTQDACLRRSAGFEILTGRAPTVDCARCLPLHDLP